jgi:hypothetical protein
MSTLLSTAIDTRAEVVCYIAPEIKPYQIISGSVSDDSAIDTGIVKTRGTIEINGILTPPRGTSVWVEYTYTANFGRVTQSIPRELRVITSFADPIRRTTKLEIGCTFTLRSEFSDPNLPTLSGKSFVQQPINITPEELEVAFTETEIVIAPIRAQSVGEYIKTRLGITGATMPLLNLFSIKEFDASGPYVQILSDLLKSESVVIRAEQLRKVILTNNTITDANKPTEWVLVAEKGKSTAESKSRVIDTRTIIDLGPINGGQVPPDRVVVRYSTLVLAAPDDVELRCGPEFPEDELDEALGDRLVESASTINTSIIYIPYSTPSVGPNPPAGTPISRTREYTTLESSYDETIFRTLQFRDPEASTSPISDPTDEEFFTAVESGLNFQTVSKTVPIQRKTIEERSAVSIAGGVVQNYLSAGIDFGDFRISNETIETYSYDQFGNETRRSLNKFGSALFGFGSAGVQMVFEDEQGNVSAVPLPTGRMFLEGADVTTTRNGSIVTTVTERYGPWLATIPGQQSIAEGREALDTAAKVSTYLNQALGGKNLLDVTTSTTFSPAGSQEAPSPLDDLSEEFADEDTSDPSNGFRTESETGTATAAISGIAGGTGEILSLSIPYADDDTFSFRLESRTDDEGDKFYVRCYYSSKSDAQARAATYGRFQLMLVRGSRLGLSLQLPVYAMPTEPLEPVTVAISESGQRAVYAADAISWTFDANGIVGSMDGLYMGTAGRGLT